MTIVFDIYPSFGHQHATYKLAKILQEAGHTIYYIGDDRYFKNLPPEFNRRNIHPFVFSLLDKTTIDVGKSLKTAFEEKRKHEFYHFNQQTIRQYDALMEEIKPDIILVDHHYVQKAAMYYKYQVPVVSVQTAPASEMDANIPPFRSAHIPDRRLFSKIYVRYLWYSYLLVKKIRFFYYSLVLLGEDHLSDVRRLAKQTGYPLKKNIDYNHYKGNGEFGLKNIPQLLLSPRDFDFPRPLKPNQYAIGPLIYKESDIKPDEKRYQAVIDHILKEKTKRAISVIYCSLGTLNTMGYRNSVMTFLYVIAIAQRNPDYRVVISSGEFVNPAMLLPTPDNVFLFKTLPQKHILQYCDMMIAHGGQNSITECVMNEVPLLIYPFFKGSDLGGNSARVVYHGIGARGFIEKETDTVMEKKIRDVLTNPVYRNNIHAMRLKFEEKNCSTRAVEIIETIVNEYKNGNTGY